MPAGPPKELKNIIENHNPCGIVWMFCHYLEN